MRKKSATKGTENQKKKEKNWGYVRDDTIKTWVTTNELIRKKKKVSGALKELGDVQAGGGGEWGMGSNSRLRLIPKPPKHNPQPGRYMGFDGLGEVWELGGEKSPKGRGNREINPQRRRKEMHVRVCYVKSKVRQPGRSKRPGG